MTEPDSIADLMDTMQRWTATFIKGQGRVPSEHELVALWVGVQRASGVPECMIAPSDQRCLTLPQMGALDLDLTEDGRTVIFRRHLAPNCIYVARINLPMPITLDALLPIDRWAETLPTLSWRPMVDA